MNAIKTLDKATKGYKTHLSAFLLFIASISGIISPDEANQLTELIVAIIGFVGVIWGRIDANRVVE